MTFDPQVYRIIDQIKDAPFKEDEVTFIRYESPWWNRDIKPKYIILAVVLAILFYVGMPYWLPIIFDTIF